MQCLLGNLGKVHDRPGTPDGSGRFELPESVKGMDDHVPDMLLELPVLFGRDRAIVTGSSVEVREPDRPELETVQGTGNPLRPRWQLLYCPRRYR